MSSNEETKEGSPKKEQETILEQHMEEGVSTLERQGAGLFLSGISAGLDVGFTLFAISIFGALYGWAPDDPVFRMTIALLYSVGYVFVVIGGSELFTEHTTLAVMPVFDGRASLVQLGRLWGLVYMGNVIGAGAFGAIFGLVGPALGFTDAATLSHIGHKLASPEAWMILVSGVLAGWLMGLLSWLVTASRETTSQIVIVVLVTSVIGLGPLHHCVVGTAELAAAMMTNGVELWPGVVALTWATIGNAIGGVLFVALLKYSVIVRSRYSPP